VQIYSLNLRIGLLQKRNKKREIILSSSKPQPSSISMKKVEGQDLNTAYTLAPLSVSS